MTKGWKPLSLMTIVTSVLVLATVLVPGGQVRAAHWLQYDNGTWWAGSTWPFQGVRFSLPGCLGSAKLVTVRLAYTGSACDVKIHITGDDHTTDLTTPITHNCAGGVWEDVNVSASNIIVPSNFYIILERVGTCGNAVIDSDGSVGRSYHGSSLAGLTSATPCDLLIRAEIDGSYIDRVGFCHLTADSLKNKFYRCGYNGTTTVVKYKKLSNLKPATGDWDGDGVDDVGFCQLTADTSKNIFHLRKGDGTTTKIKYKKLSSLKPITGDWDKDGDDDVGFCLLTANTSQNVFYLRNGDGTTTVIKYKKLSSLKPITGDWDGDGDDDVGFCRLTADTSKNTFSLRNGDGTTTKIEYKKLSSLKPITGDWDRDGDDDVGFCKLTANTSKNVFYLRNGDGTTSIIEYKKLKNLKPITGDWNHST